MKTWSGFIDPCVFDMGSRKLVTSFTPRPLYPRYPLDRRLGGPENQPGWFKEEKKNLAPTATGTLNALPSSQ
jgi:hypothetical protein